MTLGCVFVLSALLARCRPGVLIPVSAAQPLMKDSRSPIIDFFPTDFRVDQEGKRNDWEGVVLVPFIDEARLLQVRSPRTDRHKIKRSSGAWQGALLQVKIQIGRDLRV